MFTYDLVIEGAHVFIDSDLHQANIAVENGKIAKISKLPMYGSKKLTLEGKILLPGLIDIHSHMREPGYTYKEDYATGSMAAAAGGVTMFVDMPNVKPPTDSLTEFEIKRKLASEKSIVDFNHFVFPKLNQISLVARAGCAGFKFFMIKGEYPYDERVCIEDHGEIYKIFKTISLTGLPCVVHPSDNSLIKALYEERIVSRSTEPKFVSYGKAFTDETVYSTSVSTLLFLAAKTGVTLHILHVQAESAIDLIRKAKQSRNVNVTAEIDPLFLLTSKTDLARLGPLVIPGGLFSEKRSKAIWSALKDGTIDAISTDHAPHAKSEILKTAARSPLLAPFGSPQLEHYLPVLLTKVNSGVLNISQLVGATSTNPARIVNVYPRKGIIRVGSDADLVVIDMKMKKILSNDRLYTKVGWSPYEGKKVKGVPIMTFVRGELVMENGEVLAKPGVGKFIPPIVSKTVAAN